MKRYLIFIALILATCYWLNSSIANNYGQFGVGTSSTDSAFLFTLTFDTLGQSANADSVYFITLWRGTLRVDSVRVTSPTRTGYFTTARRAVDSTTAPAGRKLGEYVVYIKWWINGGKVFNRADCYTVIDTVHTPRYGYNINFSYPDSILKLRGLAIRGTTGSDTALIAAGIGYGIGLFISGGSTGADGIYALGGGTGAGLHAKGGSGDGAEGIFAEGTGSGPGTYSLGGSSAPGLQVIGQGLGAGIRADGGSSGNGITATGFATGSGIRAVKGGTGYDIYGDRQGSLSGSVGSVTGNVGGNVVGSVASVTGAVGSVTGAVNVGSANANAFEQGDFTQGYWHNIAIYSDSGNVGGAATDWTTAERSQMRRVLGITGDTITQASYGFLDAQISTRSTLTSSDNIGINWADIINATASVTLSGTNISTNQGIASVSGSVGSVTGAVGSVSSAVTVGTNNDKIGYSLSGTQTFNNTGTWTGNLSGSVGSVTGTVIVGTNNDKTGYSLAGTQTFNNTGTWTGNLTGSVGSVTGAVTVGTNNDKTGYALTTNYLTKADTSSTGASYFRAKYVEDKTSYQLSTQGETNIWTHTATGENTGWAKIIKDFAKVLTGGTNYRQIYYRPTATAAPDSLRIYDTGTLIGRQLYWYGSGGKLDSVRSYTYGN